MEKIEYAKFYTRARALFIDVFILGLLFLAMLFMSKVVLELDENESYLATLFYISSFLYFMLLDASFLQGTFGKLIAKIKVIDNEGNRLSYKKSAIRTLVKMLTFFILGIGYLLALFTKKNQALQDKVAYTYIVKYEDYSSIVKTDIQNIIFTILLFIGKSIYIIIVVLLVFLWIMSALDSEAAKAVGDFIVMVVGGAIWIGIFYIVYKVKTSPAGQAFSSMSSKIGDSLKTNPTDDKNTSKEEPSKEKLSSVNETKTVEKAKKVGEVNLILGLSDFGDRKKNIMFFEGKYTCNVDALSSSLKASSFSELKKALEEYYIKRNIKFSIKEL